MPKLKIELEIAEADMLLNVLTKVQANGLPAMRQIVALCERIANPINASELNRDTLLSLQALIQDKKVPKKEDKPKPAKKQEEK